MEIIRRGQDPREKDYYGTCYNCKTEVKFKRHEGTYTPGYDQRDGPTITVICPVCNDRAIVVAA